MLGFDCISTLPISYEDFWVNSPDFAGLQFLHTGASSVGASQPEQASSLGGKVSDTIATRVGVDEVATIPTVEILDASHQVGNGSLIPMGGTALTYTGPNGTPGTPVTPTPNVPVMVADTLNQWVLVNQTTDAAMTGATTAAFVDQWNNCFGQNNSTVSGETTYRGVMISNNAPHPFFNITLSVGVINTAACTSPLPSSGAGYIGGDFLMWPWAGFVQASSGDVFYFASRTNEFLQVPSSGRGLFGTTIGGGAAGDTLNCIPPIQLATETPVASAIQGPLTNETTSPTGRSFSNSVTIPVLWAGQQMGLWIQRVLPSGLTAYPMFQNVISLTYDISETEFADELVGLYRVSDSSLIAYELWIGQDAPPQLLGPPNYTFTGTSYSVSLAPGHTYYLSTGQRDEYNLVSENTNFEVIVVTGSGGQGNSPPSAPTNATITALGSSGQFQVTATYYFLQDNPPADTFYVYISFDGSAPLDETPVSVSVGTNQGGVYVLNYVTAAHLLGTTARCVVRTYSSTTTEQSTNTNEIDATSAATPFTNLGVKGFYAQLTEQKD